ncbi:MAG TPA: hypothetical protein VFW83_08020, partial [Bryobacteraceae bacterium]|nr:hypothetical protein [Bryobacteraceae bacterium]
MRRMKSGAWTVGILAAAAVLGQTQIDLPTQTKHVDFSSAAETRPAKTGTALPATCSTGDQFFQTSAVPGLNLYGCTATNVWTLQSGSSGANCVASNSGGAVQLSAPCVVWLGTASYTLGGAATFTPTSGSGTVFLYLSAFGVFTAGTDAEGTCNANCTVASGVSSYPVDAVPLAHATITNGVLGAIADDRS